MDSFIEQVEKILNTKSPAEMRSTILNLAVTMPEDSQRDFLLLLANDRVAISAITDSSFDPEAVSTRTKALLEDVEDYYIEAHFYESYGWDYDSDSYGWTIESDDGFSNEFIRCFNGAVATLRHGFYKKASEAFDMLRKTIDKFDEYHENDDEGALYFNTLIKEGLIEIKFEYIEKLFFYSSLMAQPEDIQSLFSDLFHVLRSYRKLLTFSDILVAGTQPIPGGDSITDQWVMFLYRQDPKLAADFIKEAALIIGRQELLVDYVNSVGAKEPNAYKNLCDLYISNDQVEYIEIRDLAIRGLMNSDATLLRRADLADLLASVAGDTCDTDTYLYAISERFRSNPSLVNFIPIIKAGKSLYIEQSINNLDTSVRPTGSRKSSSEYGDYYIIHFLNKDYDMVYDAFKNDTASLGWSYSLKGAMIPLFIGLLAGFNENAVAIQRMIVEQLGREVDFAVFYQLLRENIGLVTPDQVKTWRDRCFQEAGKRIDAIVSGKHRGSYRKAALVLVSLYELQLYNGDAEPLNIIYKYKEKYLRFSAFRSEVRTVLAYANILGVKF